MNNLSVASIMAVVNTVLAAIVSFGVSLTDTQVTAITAAINAIIVLIYAILHRNSNNKKVS